jgi:hypothetical protein
MPDYCSDHILATLRRILSLSATDADTLCRLIPEIVHAQLDEDDRIRRDNQ